MSARMVSPPTSARNSAGSGARTRRSANSGYSPGFVDIWVKVPLFSDGYRSRDHGDKGGVDDGGQC